MQSLDVARKSMKIKDKSKISKLRKKTKTSSPCSYVWISHVSLAEVLVELDDCIQVAMKNPLQEANGSLPVALTPASRD